MQCHLLSGQDSIAKCILTKRRGVDIRFRSGTVLIRRTMAWCGGRSWSLLLCFPYTVLCAWLTTHVKTFGKCVRPARIDLCVLFFLYMPCSPCCFVYLEAICWGAGVPSCVVYAAIVFLYCVMQEHFYMCMA